MHGFFIYMLMLINYINTNKQGDLRTTFNKNIIIHKKYSSRNIFFCFKNIGFEIAINTVIIDILHI